MTFPKTIPFFILIVLVCIQCKKENTLVNPLSAPDNWRKETIEFPLSFAPSLDHKGTEYVRFAPGWGKEGSDEYFSYAFLWYLNENPQLSSTQLESELEVYFDGLMQVVSKPKTNSSINIKKTKAFFEKIDEYSYAGTVITYDAFTTKKEVHLNIVATSSYCKNLDKYLVLFRISPQKIDHPIWDKLNKIQVSPNCK